MSALYLADLRVRLERRELTRGPRYYVSQEAALSRMAQRFTVCADVEPGWKDALKDWHAEGTTWRTLQIVTVATRAFLRWAWQAGYLPARPVLEAPKTEDVVLEEEERRPFTAQERDRFLREVRKLDPAAWRIYVILFYTAARKSDLERLTLRQIDWRSGFVGLPPRQTKGRTREQVLYLPAKALAAMRAEVRARKVVDPAALVFGPFSLRRVFARALDAAGIKDRKGLVPHHVTRHTAATLAGEGGATLAELMALGRWTTPGMAARYMKVRAALAKKAADRL